MRHIDARGGVRHQEPGRCVATSRRLAAHSRDGTCTVDDILNHLRRQSSSYKPSTIRTHVVSRMYANAPDHHQVTYPDLLRGDDRTYKLNAAE